MNDPRGARVAVYIDFDESNRWMVQLTPAITGP
jgi:hypothetical protein